MTIVVVSCVGMINVGGGKAVSGRMLGRPEGKKVGVAEEKRRERRKSVYNIARRFAADQ